ncbi:alkaline shock response membrane anchor protein AmaP [Halostreptopolyspora alba]|uniref:Alkaline shock response membrane anchor protein AmaP n=1 Tax=Halostreptopolyspora alba TaxID=2487137 RepID=A0A3N0ED17_9ACTN|nr:alkaline shock response membrane anchor protein AmaP [Nocardiopsaceae bacterium YIM 96095]
MPLGTRTRRAARANRWGLGILGVLLAGAGAASLAAGLGAFGAGTAESPLLGRAVLDWLGQPWVPYAVVVLAVVVALVALWWLVSQGRSDTTGRLRVDEESTRGITEIPSAAVRDVLEDRAGRHPEVRRARARLTGSSYEPGVVLDLTVDADADATSLWRRLRDEELATLRGSLELDELPAVIRMSMSAPPKDRPRELR